MKKTIKTCGILEYEVAQTWLKRFWGLMFRKKMSQYRGLLLIPCYGGRIHTHWMRFPIDAVYLDQDYMVLAIKTFTPWQIGPTVKGAHAVLELNAGTAKELGLVVGTKIN